MFEKFKAKLAKSRLLEEKLYQEVLRELNENIIRDGLWAKALADSDGSEEKAKSKYIKLRVQSMKDEEELIQDEKRKEDEKLFDAFIHEMEERERTATTFLTNRGFRVKKKSKGWEVREPYNRTIHIFPTIEKLEKFVDSKKD